MEVGRLQLPVLSPLFVVDFLLQSVVGVLSFLCLEDLSLVYPYPPTALE